MEHSQWIQNAIHYMKSAYGQTALSLPDVAVHAGFSMDYFNRLFTAHTGFTVMAYLSYWRLKEAAQLLRNTDRSVLDIALAVGYDSHEGFLRAFKKQYGQTPSDYRQSKQTKVTRYSDLVDRSVIRRFLHETPDFTLIDSDTAIDCLLAKDAKRFGYLCTTILCHGLWVIAPSPDMENGFLCVGDDLKGGHFLELLTEDFDQLAIWLERFPEAEAFYSPHAPEVVNAALGDRFALHPTPQSIYTGDSLPVTLPAGITVRPLSYADREAIRLWAGGKQDGYTRHLLTEKDYQDDSVLEYGVFQGERMIAAVGCGIERVHGLELNNCCHIRFAPGMGTDELYRAVFAFVVNDVLDKGLVPFDDLQHGAFAETHGDFTATDMGFEVVNWKYSVQRHA